MPQSPRAHVSGVPAERDHWLRSRDAYLFNVPFAQRIRFRMRQSESVKIELLSIRIQGLNLSIGTIAYLEFLIFYLILYNTSFLT